MLTQKLILLVLVVMAGVVQAEEARMSRCASPEVVYGTLSARAQKWQRKVVFGDGTNFSDTQLNFEPGICLFSPQGTCLLVADAFGGELALIDTRTREIIDQISIIGHNIRGLKFLNRQTLLMTHQVLHADVPTSANNIAAGLVIENVLHEIKLVESKTGEGLKLVSGTLKELGVPSRGAADPAGIEVDHTGNIWIALSGVDEVLVMNSSWNQLARVSVKKRPWAVYECSGSILVVHNDESHVLIDPDTRQLLHAEEIAQGFLKESQTTNRERGEDLFFDANVSRFGWFSCHSCHPDGHTNYQLADTFADETAGAPKRVLSLLGGRDNNPWAWNGTMRSLHDQVLQSGKTTMQGRGFRAKEVNDVVAYLHTLESPPPFQPATNEDDLLVIELGRTLFNKLGCAECHVPPLTYTSDGTFDVGLVDENGLKKFNPPTLIGVGYRRRLFHDGRAMSLEDVLTDHAHQLSEKLSDEQLTILLRFLRSL